ncbi:MAG: hypothetical protein QXG65_02565 [Thermoplasmata archaeon]
MSAALPPTLAISIATAGGILLSALFVLWEFGHHATPQVRVSRFDERRGIFSYTLGLFVGILATVPFELYLFWAGAGNVLSAFVFLAVVVGITEGAQAAIRRTHYWGTGPSFPFYAAGLRCGIAGLLAVAVLSSPLAANPPSPVAIVLSILAAVALLLLMVTSALLSLPPDPAGGRRGGGPVSGALLLFAGLFLVAFPYFAGPATGAVALLLAIGGSGYLYARLRSTFDRVLPPRPPGSAARPAPGRFARQEPRAAGPPR